MPQEMLALLLIMSLGAVGKNPAVVIASGLLLLLQIFELNAALTYLSDYGIRLGIIFLMLGILVPFGNGDLSLRTMVETFRTSAGAAAIVGGTFAGYLGGRGLRLLELQPEIVIGLILGTLISILFFNGIPIGPLVAGGIVSLLIGLTRLG